MIINVLLWAIIRANIHLREIKWNFGVSYRVSLIYYGLACNNKWVCWIRTVHLNYSQYKCLCIWNCIIRGSGYCANSTYCVIFCIGIIISLPWNWWSIYLTYWSELSIRRNRYRWVNDVWIITIIVNGSSIYWKKVIGSLSIRYYVDLVFICRAV